jgi:molybdopterin-guanine dinucleotide biosynthesis protein A
MGRDKATLDLGGKPLVARAVEKLRRVCAEVKVLSRDPGLEAYAPVVRDLHADCGPMGGMEAALASSGFDWNLFLPVDVPFLPAAYLEEWVRGTLPGAEERGARVLMFMVDEIAQPTLALVHREVRPYLTASLEAGRYRLAPVLVEAARAIAVREGRLPEAGIWIDEVGEAASRVWFSNLNTPEDFVEAERHLEALDA